MLIDDILALCLLAIVASFAFCALAMAVMMWRDLWKGHY